MTAEKDGPVGLAGSFLDAIVWGEHTTLWELLSDQGRETVLAVAVNNGLDLVVAGRLRDDLADPVEREEFLGELLAGLRRDLRSVDLDNLSVAGHFNPVSEHVVSVDLLTPSQIPGTGSWPAGSIQLSRDETRGWCVDRIEPRIVAP